MWLPFRHFCYLFKSFLRSKHEAAKSRRLFGTKVWAALFHEGGEGLLGIGLLQALRNHPQEDAQHHVEHCPVMLHEVARPLLDRQHPLAHRQAVPCAMPWIMVRGRQYSVQMSNDPGPSIQLQVSGVVVMAPPAYPVYYARSYYPPTTLELGYGPLGRLPGAMSLALMAGADRTFKPEATGFVFLPLPRGG